MRAYLTITLVTPLVYFPAFTRPNTYQALFIACIALICHQRDVLLYIRML